VVAERAEEARARLIALFPEGFEEMEGPDGLELAVYTDGPGEERLRAAFPRVEAVDVPDDWRDRWRTFHRGARIGTLWVGPPWEDPPPDAVPVVIDPGRAFGTGGHATTRLCLDLIQGLPRGSLLDIGCGSGVLAVAAAKLGFAPVIAVDNESAAVEATAENAERNGVSVEARLGDALQGPLPGTDVAVANITAEALPWLPLRSATAVTSGYLADDDVRLPAYVHVERRRLEGWAADHFRRAS
jgi:ribosomal protein L11 methyltransferase